MSNAENTPIRVPEETMPEEASDIVWLNTQTAAQRLGITTRTLYRFINEGSLPAYRMGRVIRVKRSDVDVFIDASRIEPGTLSHLYPDPVSSNKADEGSESSEPQYLSEL
ncbi:MAG: helix-turn-helix domain-containing protein [Acidimicrobiia bacterium]|nr:helix-turn-helix domain-containing protein [Acidimicrobiia bacterium]MYC57377.1 helix-turn-helix domain-containing protein [Acidimicrobiia bacterium]MYG94580.1 helix-turn-helix domain-containing protein [Acidimicrobiia bacterium]MYI31137.1 helix-turn-helix domain-containing protein [Acidimicrobiia bacterium]